MELLIVIAVVAIIVYFKMDFFAAIFGKVHEHFNIKYCVHEFDREVNHQGYQFCLKCKCGRLVGLADCVHDWETLEKYKVTDSLTKAVVKNVFVLKCKKCGDMKNHET